MSSTPAKTRRALLGTAGLVALASLALLLLPGSRSSGLAQGTVLNGGMQSTGTVGSEHAHVGQEYWVGLPVTFNTSNKPVTVLDGTILQVPQGLKLLRYGAFSAEELGDNLLLASDSESMRQVDRAKDHHGEPIRIPPHDSADVYFMARVRVTGPVRGLLSGCRYRYRQGDVEYQQDLRCRTEIKLGPS
ncbi:hypothetical protein [Streptomyces sp. NPDC001340]